MASASSFISSALTDTETRRVALSMPVIMASIRSPTAKRSGRCSLRSRDRSDLRTKAVTGASSSPNLTSMPPVSIDVTVTVICWPRL
ncbi:hypothetical protein D3C87_1281070 [compost metagenome]